ncbi:MAG: HD domain-containing protein [Candidatus Humimicrobiaceae bacterium]
MISNSLFLKIFDAASMQRWNDQIKIVEFSELDKQAQKMVVAYILAKFESEKNGEVDWIKIIKVGLFEYFQRIILTDLKPPLFYKIKEDKSKYHALNEWVYKEMEPYISSLGDNFCSEFKDFLLDTELKEKEDINRQILNAAHFYVTKWEFDIIETINPKGFQIEEIKRDIKLKQEEYRHLSSMKELVSSTQLTDFVNICGQLRFQVRWSHLYRVPKTSVLGHMLIVAILSFLFSYVTGKDRINTINNYLTGLFHDLPEVLTRDIINPVKRSVKGLSNLIKDYEKEEMEKKIYKLIPESWHKDIKLFTENEFSDIENRDGSMVKAADDLSAFLEAYLSVKNGIQNNDFVEALEHIEKKYRDKVISGIDMYSIFKGFRG